MPTRESQEVVDTDQARETLSRAVLKEARRAQRFELPAPYSLMTLLPGDDVAVTHYGGPDSEGDGWGPRSFEREHAEVEGIAYDPDARIFTLGLRDVRNALLRNVWLPGAIRAQMGRIQDGEGVVCGSQRFWWRPTVAYVLDPLTGIPSQVYYHRPKLTEKGFLIERFRTNIIRNSGLTDNSGAGWSANGTGVGGSSIVNADPSVQVNLNLYWPPDPPDGPQLTPLMVLKFGSGVPHTADLYYQQVCFDNVTNGNTYTLQLIHLENIAQVVAPSFQLLLNGNFWNVGTQAFQAGAIWNQLAGSGNSWTRENIRFLANFTGVPTLRFGYPNGVASNVSCFFTHAQIDVGRAGASTPWASGLIATPNTPAIAFAEGDVVIIDNGTDYRVWNASQGTALFTLTTLWNTAQVAGMFFTVFKVKYDANNSIELFYDGTNTRFTLRRISNGATTDLNSGVVTIVAGVPVTIEVRWTGDYGELVDTYGAPSGSNRWFDMIVNGTRVAGTQSPTPIENATSVLVMGGEESRQVDSYLKAQLTPYVLTENQCAKWRLSS